MSNHTSSKPGFAVLPYDESWRVRWDEFISSSRNGTFLLQRGYLGYHANRFHDASLLVVDSRNELVTVLPACQNGDGVSSHGGLTYGGFVVDDRMTQGRMLDVFELVLAHLKQLGIRALAYKPVPWFYTRYPCEEDRYALFLAGAKLERRSAAIVIPREGRIPIQERRRRGIKRAAAKGVTFRESSDLSQYWQVLSEVLSAVHGAKPVHTLDEISLLHARFPSNLRLFCAFAGEQLVAGVLVFETLQVARAQYIASNQTGREVGALDGLFAFLLNEVFSQKPFFEFGTSDIERGRRLNVGLIEQKEGYGGRVVCFDEYSIDVTAWLPGSCSNALGDSVASVDAGEAT